MVLNCELLPLSHYSTHVVNKAEKNLLVVFDVLCTVCHSVRDRLRTLSEVLWDGHCKHCLRPYTVTDYLCGSPSHSRCQRVVASAISLSTNCVCTTSVFRDEEERLKNESPSDCAKLYDGLIRLDSECFKFKRGALVTLDVAIPSREADHLIVECEFRRASDREGLLIAFASLTVD